MTTDEPTRFGSAYRSRHDQAKYDWVQLDEAEKAREFADKLAREVAHLRCTVDGPVGLAGPVELRDRSLRLTGGTKRRNGTKAFDRALTRRALRGALLIVFSPFLFAVAAMYLMLLTARMAFTAHAYGVKMRHLNPDPKPGQPINRTPCGPLCEYAIWKTGVLGGPKNWFCYVNGALTCDHSRPHFTSQDNPNNCMQFQSTTQLGPMRYRPGRGSPVKIAEGRACSVCHEGRGCSVCGETSHERPDAS